MNVDNVDDERDVTTAACAEMLQSARSDAVVLGDATVIVTIPRGACPLPEDSS